jgi:hypothetical protein
LIGSNGLPIAAHTNATGAAIAAVNADVLKCIRGPDVATWVLETNAPTIRPLRHGFGQRILVRGSDPDSS